jgi:hypothetical protein
MKRSTQVSLVLMTAAGIGGGAYALTPRDSCRQPAPSAVASDTAQDCRSSRGGSGHGSSGHFFSGSGSSGSGASAATPSTSTSTSSGRGGFGTIGRAFSAFGGS